MIRGLGRYVMSVYPPAIQVPFMALWAVGLTAVLACVSGGEPRRHLAAELVITTVTLVVDMLLLRALDDIRDHDYDRVHNPRRPLPSGVVRERDLCVLIGCGTAFLLVLNAGNGVALLILASQLGYTAGIVTVDRLAGWPPDGRLLLQLAVNLPVQPLLSLYVYVSFLRAEHDRPSPAGFLLILGVTLAAVCLEFGRKATHRPASGERTYAAVLGPSVTSGIAVAAATAATITVLVILRPWQPASAGYGWAWLVLLPLALPVAAAARFSAGAMRWPVPLTLAYIPVMYLTFLVIDLLEKGTPW